GSLSSVGGIAGGTVSLGGMGGGGSSCVLKPACCTPLISPPGAGFALTASGAEPGMMPAIHFRTGPVFLSVALPLGSAGGSAAGGGTAPGKDGEALAPSTSLTG